MADTPPTNGRNGYRGNGGWAWVSRIGTGVLMLLLTVIGTLALGTLNNLSDSVAGMGAEIKAIRTELADLRERLAGNYITRDETQILIEAAESRLDRRIDREHPPRRTPP